MSAESLLVSILKSSAPVTNIVGTKIFPVYEKEVGTPAIFYSRQSTETVNHLQGVSPLSKAELVIDFYGESFAQCETLAIALKTLLVGYRSLPMVQGIFLVDELSEPELNVNPPAYHGQQTYAFWNL